MGLLSGAASAVVTAANVGAGVFNIVKGLGKTAISLGTSKIGKFAIAAGATVMLMRDPTGNGNSLASRFGRGFMDFFGTMADNIRGKASSRASETALSAAAMGTRIGEGVQDALDAANISSQSDAESLRAAVPNSETFVPEQDLAVEPEQPAQEGAAQQVAVESVPDIQAGA